MGNILTQPEDPRRPSLLRSSGNSNWGRELTIFLHRTTLTVDTLHGEVSGLSLGTPALPTLRWTCITATVAPRS